MSITLTPHTERQIREWIEHRGYPDAETVIEKALGALEAQEQSRFLKLQALVLAGRDSGEGEELTPELWDRLAREAEEDDRLGLPIRDEVQP